MDLNKIGKFISDKRKEFGLTQSQLAEKLFVTDRAVSKWERGKSLPNTESMVELCKIFNISLTELINGETSSSNTLNQTENQLLALIKEKENSDKRLLLFEIFLGIITVISTLTCIFVAAYAPIDEWLRIVLIIIGVVLGLMGSSVALIIEHKAGYYKCTECGYTYVPKFKNFILAPHFGRSRLMKCPKCGKHTYQKKVVSKSEVKE